MKKPVAPKKLRLNVETIRQLDARDLAAVVGGGDSYTCSVTCHCLY
jgi:natural product precursor